MGRILEMAVGALNGAVGDYLVRTGNGLATEMAFIQDGRPLALESASLSRAHPTASGRVAVLVHGLMCTEDIWTLPDGSDYGGMLARDLGFTPLYLRYNTGLPIPDNGALLARMLSDLLAFWPVPVEEILPLGYSMGGLVVRSACHQASLEAHPWLEKINRAIYVGTPHLGAPLERFGRVFTKVMRAVPDPYTRLIAQLGDLRSEGLQDLGDADLRHDDRIRRRPQVALRDPQHPVPLLPGIRHYLAAGSLSVEPRLAVLFGDILVPISSGTDGNCVDPASFALPPENVKLFPGTNHVALAHHPDVYAQIRAWCEEDES